MYCKYLSKKVNGGFKCKKYKQSIISLDSCKNCLEFDLKRNKPIKKVSNKRNKLEKNRFSIFTNNFNQCYYCKRKVKENEKLDLHEVYGGSNRLRSIRMGFVVPLCRKCHSNEKVINYLRILIQKEFEKTHTREEFIKITGKSYIKGDDK
jgi:hypothetical protein